MPLTESEFNKHYLLLSSHSRCPARFFGDYWGETRASWRKCALLCLAELHGFSLRETSSQEKGQDKGTTREQGWFVLKRISQLEKKTKSVPWNWATDNKSVNVKQWSGYWLGLKKIMIVQEKYRLGHLVGVRVPSLSVTLAADLLRLLITKGEANRRKFLLSLSCVPQGQSSRLWKTAPALAPGFQKQRALPTNGSRLQTSLLVWPLGCVVGTRDVDSFSFKGGTKTSQRFFLH